MATQIAGAFVTRWSRFRSWLRSAPARFDGTHIADHDPLTHLGIGATFEPSDKIVSFYRENKDRPTVVKALRLVETHPDADKIHAAEDFNLPIG